ncbi:MAG: hemolysin family protein [Hyphomicrobiales bacterium]
MDDDPPSAGTSPATPEHRADGPNLWARLKSLITPGRDASLKESIEGVIERHTGDAESLIRPEARSMLLKLIEFSDLKVSDVMVPRADIVAIEHAASVRELLDRFIEAGHSRLPVYRETLDDPVGMVHIKDLMRWMSERSTLDKPSRRKRTAKTPAPKPQAMSLSAEDLAMTIKQTGLVRTLLFVPPSMRAADLLVKMQSTRIHMAIVVDEYGGTDGVATIEDLVEEIVGDIADEHDEAEEAMIRPVGQNLYLADARAPIEDVEGLLGLDLLPDDREEEADTLGGLVFSMLGRVPVRGELVRHPSGVEFEIVESDPRRVKKIRIHTVSPGEAPAPQDTPKGDGDTLDDGG